jgi:hypothetical protein
MKVFFKILSAILFLIVLSLIIFSLQLKKEIDFKEKAVEHLIHSWSNYIDSTSIEIKAYQDTIKDLRINIEKSK